MLHTFSLLYNSDVPAKPGPIEYADIVRDGVTLKWTPPKDDGGTDILSYIVERRDAKRSTYTRAGKVEGNVTQLKVSGLVEGTEYFFQVTAENEVGKSEPRESDSGVVPKSPFGRLQLANSSLRFLPKWGWVW